MPKLVRETIRPYRVEARIPLHLDICDEAVAELVDLHQRVGAAHGTNLKREGARETAIWELSGHALAMAKSFLVLLRGGYVPGAMVQARALHETLSATFAVVDRGEDTILKAYFAGQDLKPEAVRRATHRGQDRARKAGAKVGDLRAPATYLYSGLSGFAHNRRTAIEDAVSKEPGVFAYGPHPDPYQRGSHTSYGTALVVELVTVVTFALGQIEGFRESREDLGKPLLRRLEDVQTRYPLRSFQG